MALANTASPCMVNHHLSLPRRPRTAVRRHHPAASHLRANPPIGSHPLSQVDREPTEFEVMSPFSHISIDN
jgi:hypothetical protein